MVLQIRGQRSGKGGGYENGGYGSADLRSGRKGGYEEGGGAFTGNKETDNF